ncbi:MULTISPECIES: ATP-binding protein [unclassified Aureimonas]|uniref:HD domain-containing protein n=1 Tax=unclassified Aureimonas TaxID=2615206 RepID=UPI000A57650B|nr:MULTISPECIES: ATP-binding protein [unclassified Aureimonas]
MDDIPFTELEVLADEATKLPAFSINLTNVRSAVSRILSEWKSSGVFFEYTDHTFAHVTDMLKAAEWIIPSETKSIMTKGDWLMLTLSVYMHDVGLLVTKDEYEARSSNPDYQTFKSSPILPSDKHKEYIARLGQMPTAEAERIQYQEFVRTSHGKRIRAWIEGGSLNDNGATEPLRSLINGLLHPLDATFRRDLAIICESHTLGHSEAVASLKVSQPYGGPQETVNLQYIAVILRTIDLVQITNRRAPTVLYQIINPSNPISQVEWQKQGVVRTVRAAPPRDRDNRVTKMGVSSTIEVHATFKEPNGFFGLTSYLAYAQKELNASYSLVQKSSGDVIEPYSFPWRDIDDKGIDTDGFMTESFEFSLDQHKILDLLTGHTLYNNSTVVLRELTQNALDAVRLQSVIDKAASPSRAVEIYWDSNSRELTVLDRGTGMSQEVIEKHLLTVGSSKYQDQKFKERHPDFHSISRFGIGVLSAFMVSDDVEITTCSVDDDKARRIALQSVHGKYLIKLLDKVKDRSQLPMYPHGTAVRLKLRPLAEIGDVLHVARSWLMFPRCDVKVYIDDKEPVTVGFGSPRQAISTYVDYLQSRRDKIEYRVEEITRDEVTMAFALSRTELFQDWTFVTAPTGRRASIVDEMPQPVATCIEGVAVERTTPGFQGQSILAVANATGTKAPKTNVARSALEDTAEQRQMLKTVYDIYGDHITAEISRLASTESYSLSRAVSFAPFIASPLIASNVAPAKPDLLRDALASVPLILVEDKNKRSNISLLELCAHSEFTTVESPLYRSIEYFVKEAPADVTSQKLMMILGNAMPQKADDLTVCNIRDGYVDEHVRSAFDIFRVTASRESRALTLTWRKHTQPTRWLSSAQVYANILKEDVNFYHQLSEASSRMRNERGYDSINNGLSVPVGEVETQNLETYGSFIANRERYLKPDTPLADYFKDLAADEGFERLPKLASSFIFVELIRSLAWSWDVINSDLFDRAAANSIVETFRPYVDKEKFVTALRGTSPKTFDSYAWERRGDGWDLS